MLSIKKIKIVSFLLALMITLVLVAIGLVYYYKIDYFLPPALSLVLVPLIIQFRASLIAIKRQKRLKRFQDRARRLEDDPHNVNIASAFNDSK